MLFIIKQSLKNRLLPLDMLSHDKKPYIACIRSCFLFLCFCSVCGDCIHTSFPGTPLNNSPVEQIVEAACAEAEVYSKCNVVCYCIKLLFSHKPTTISWCTFSVFGMWIGMHRILTEHASYFHTPWRCLPSQKVCVM